MPPEMHPEQSQPQTDSELSEDRRGVFTPSLLGTEETGFQSVAWGPVGPRLPLSCCVTQCLACQEYSAHGKSCCCCFHGHYFHSRAAFGSAVARYGKGEGPRLSRGRKVPGSGKPPSCPPHPLGLHNHLSPPLGLGGSRIRVGAQDEQNRFKRTLSCCK